MPAATPTLQQLHRLAARACLGSAPDAELVRRFTSGRDADAFATLVERYGPMVLNLCRRLIGDAHAAEDAFQATFLALARAAGSIRRPESLPAWLYGTARRFALRLRAERADRPAAWAHDLPGPDRDPLEEISARELLRILDEELARLPEGYRLPIILCAVEGLTVPEAAVRLSVPAATVRGRLERGRAKLQARLTRRGLGLSAALAALLALPRVAPSAALAEATLRLPSAATLPPVVSALADSTGFALKLKVACAVLLTVGVVGIGSAIVPADGPAKPEPANERATQPGPPARAANEVDEEDPTLCPALRRYGSLRLRGCRGPMVFIPDGKHIACVGGDAGTEVILWERSTGRKVRTFVSKASVLDLFVSKDGKHLGAIANGWNVNPIWDVGTGRKLLEFAGTTATFRSDSTQLFVLTPAAFETRDLGTGKVVNSVRVPPRGDFPGPAAIRPDGRIYVRADGVPDPDQPNGSRRADLYFCDAADGSVLGTAPMKGLGNGLAFSADGKWLAATEMTSVGVFDVETRKELVRWDGCCGSRPAVFSADGRRVAWTGHRVRHSAGLSVWLAEIGKDGEPRPVGMPTNDFTAPAFAPDGATLAVIDDGFVLSLRDVATGKDVVPPDGHTGRVHRITFSADGKHLITRDKNATLVWELASGKLLRHYPNALPAGEEPVPYQHPSAHVLSFCAADNTLRLREAVGGRPLLKVACQDGIPGAPSVPVVVSDDGSAAAIVARDHRVRVYDLATGQERCEFYPEAVTWGIALSADGRLLAGYSPEPKRGHYLIDTVTGRELDPSKRSGPIPRVTELPDGRLTAVGTEAIAWLRQRQLRDDDGTLLTPDWTFVGGLVCLSPDQRYVALRHTPGQRGVIDRAARPQVRIWEAASGRVLTHFDPPGRVEEHVQFSPDGRTFVTTALDGTVRLWEIATGQERLTLRGHLAGEVTALTFTPDGRGLVSGGADTQVLLWDVTGRAAAGLWQRTERLTPERRQGLWNELAGQDAAKAYRAIWELAADPAGTIPFIAAQVPAVTPPDAERLARLIENLNDNAFPVREKANAELARLCEAALPAIRRAQEKGGAPEQQERLQRLTESFAKSALSGERLRQVRAAEVLEHIGTPEAKQLLQEWAGGLAEARLTQEAKTALGRWR